MTFLRFVKIIENGVRIPVLLSVTLKLDPPLAETSSEVKVLLILVSLSIVLLQINVFRFDKYLLMINQLGW
jgi:hypothetical protein